jgi:hypothetical protein
MNLFWILMHITPGLYYQAHPKQGRLLLEALLHVANSSRSNAGTRTATQQRRKYEEAYTLISDFYVFLYPRYNAFNRFAGSRKHVREFLSFEGEAFVLEVVITSLEETTTGGRQKKKARRPSPSWHDRQEHCYDDRNPVWYEGRAFSLQRAVEEFHKKNEGGKSFSSPPS